MSSTIPGRTGIVHARAGCRECHGDGAGWDTRNAVGVAAQHAARTGHEVWAEQMTVMRWNAPARTDTPPQ